MPSVSRSGCPLDATRLVLVSTVNPSGDTLHRWECPLGDWAGPWYSGDASDEINQIPEVSRKTNLISGGIGITGTVDTIQLNALIPEEYDYISLSYTGDDLTGVVYKTGGSGGTTVATLALTYLASVLQTVTRT